MDEQDDELVTASPADMQAIAVKATDMISNGANPDAGDGWEEEELVEAI
jgi:hypothetical protein